MEREYASEPKMRVFQLKNNTTFFQKEVLKRGVAQPM
jgi:hypothetical protein